MVACSSMLGCCNPQPTSCNVIGKRDRSFALSVTCRNKNPGRSGDALRLLDTQHDESCLPLKHGYCVPPGMSLAAHSHPYTVLHLHITHCMSAAACIAPSVDEHIIQVILDKNHGVAHQAEGPLASAVPETLVAALLAHSTADAPYSHNVTLQSSYLSISSSTSSMSSSSSLPLLLLQLCCSAWPSLPLCSRFVLYCG